MCLPVPFLYCRINTTTNTTSVLKGITKRSWVIWFPIGFFHYIFCHRTVEDIWHRHQRWHLFSSNGQSHTTFSGGTALNIRPHWRSSRCSLRPPNRLGRGTPPPHILPPSSPRSSRHKQSLLSTSVLVPMALVSCSLDTFGISTSAILLFETFWRRLAQIIIGQMSSLSQSCMSKQWME